MISSGWFVRRRAEVVGMVEDGWMWIYWHRRCAACLQLFEVKDVYAEEDVSHFRQMVESLLQESSPEVSQLHFACGRFLLVGSTHLDRNQSSREFRGARFSVSGVLHWPSMCTSGS